MVSFVGCWRAGQSTDGKEGFLFCKLFWQLDEEKPDQGNIDRLIIGRR